MSYFDLQVNGYAGVDFNSDSLDPALVSAACEGLLAQGVEGILATIITDALPAMESRLRALVALRATVPALRRIMRGIHIEGPFLSPVDGYRGAHPADAILTASESAMQRLLDAADGLTRLVTLAPEQDPVCVSHECSLPKALSSPRDTPTPRLISCAQPSMLALPCLPTSATDAPRYCRATTTS